MLISPHRPPPTSLTVGVQIHTPSYLLSADPVKMPGTSEALARGCGSSCGAWVRVQGRTPGVADDANVADDAIQFI